MVYSFIGTITPIIPINSFSPALYKDRNGNFYFHELDNLGFIINFININIEVENIIYADRTINTTLGDYPVYCFLKEKELIFGYKNELEGVLLVLIQEIDFNINAKIIISSFYNLHGLTNNLIEKSIQNFSKKNIKINIEKRDFINTNKGTTKTNDTTFKYIMDDKIGYYSRYINQYKLTWNDVILIDRGHIYFDNYYFDFDVALDSVIHIKTFKEILMNNIVDSIIDNKLSRKILFPLIDKYFSEIDINEIKLNKIIYNDITDEELEESLKLDKYSIELELEDISNNFDLELSDENKIGDLFIMSDNIKKNRKYAYR